MIWSHFIAENISKCIFHCGVHIYRKWHNEVFITRLAPFFQTIFYGACNQLVHMDLIRKTCNIFLFGIFILAIVCNKLFLFSNIAIEDDFIVCLGCKKKKIYIYIHWNDCGDLYDVRLVSCWRMCKENEERRRSQRFIKYQPDISKKECEKWRFDCSCWCMAILKIGSWPISHVYAF